MNSPLQIAVIGGEPDLSVLMQRLSHAVSESESQHLGSFSGVDFIACEPTAGRARDILSSVDAVIVGASIHSEEDGENLAGTLRLLRRLRRDKTGHHLLALSLWGSYARELADQTSHPGIISPGAVAYDQPPVTAVLLRVREWVEILKAESENKQNKASSARPVSHSFHQQSEEPDKTSALKQSGALVNRGATSPDVTGNVERQESKMSQISAVVDAASGSIIESGNNPNWNAQSLENLQNLLGEKEAMIAALRAQLENQQRLAQNQFRASLHNRVSANPDSDEHFKKQLAERDALILELENQIEAQKSTVQNALAKSASLSQQLSEAEGQLSEASRRVAEVADQSALASRRLESAERHADELRDTVSTLTGNLSDIQSQLRAALTEQQQLAEARRVAEAELHSREAEIQQKIEEGITLRLNEQLSSHLEDARQELMRDVARERAQERADFELRLQQELREARQQVQEDSHHEVERLRSETSAANEEIKRLQTQLESSSVSQETLRDELQQLHLELHNANAARQSDAQQAETVQAEKLAAMQSLLSQADQRNAEAQETIAALNARIESLEKTMTERNQQLENLESSAAELTSAHRSVEAEFEILTVARNAAQERVLELETEQAALQQQMQQQESAVKRLTRQLRALESVYEETNSALEKEKAETVSARVSLEDFQAAQLRITELENAHLAASRQRLAMESLLNEMTAERDRLHTENQSLEQMEAVNVYLRNENDVLGKRLDELTRRLSVTEQDVAEADELVQENLKLLAAHESVREQLEMAEEKIAADKLLLEQQQEEAEKFHHQIESLQKQVQELDARNEELTNRLADMQAAGEDMMDLQRQVADLRAESEKAAALQQQVADLQAVRAEAQNLQQQLVETRQQVTELDRRALLAERSLAEQSEMDADDLLLLSRLDEAVRNSISFAVNRQIVVVASGAAVATEAVSDQTSLAGAAALQTDSIEPLPVSLNAEWMNSSFVSHSGSSSQTDADHDAQHYFDSASLLRPADSASLGSVSSDDFRTLISMGDPEDALLKDELIEVQDDPLLSELTRNSDSDL
jgi:chromosome segregation ATPase